MSATLLHRSATQRMGISIRRIKKWGNMIILLAFVLSTPMVVAHAAPQPATAAQQSAQLVSGAYFVSPTGSDANPGTLDRPWKTISKAAATVGAGKTVYVRAGVYKEKVRISRSGTQAAPVKFLAYPGELPVVDGTNTLPTSYDGLISVKADWVTVTGFEIRNSKYMGVGLYGKHDTISGSYVHHTQKSGINISGDYGAAIANRVWRASILNEYGKSSTWSTGITASRDSTDGLTQYAIIRGNVVWEVWGQGISTYESDHILMEDNIVHDSYATNIYLSDTTNTLCQRNFVYMNPNSYVFGHGANVGIMMGDEKAKPASANNKVINNIAYYNRRNFYWWQGNFNGGLINDVIANNTFVNAAAVNNIQINSGAHKNTLIDNNIINQDGSLAIALVAKNSELHFSNNLWSKTPPSSVTGPGTVVSAPQFTKTGGSPFTSSYFQLVSASPAVNKALPLSDVPNDYASKLRIAPPDIGAYELVAP